MNVKKIFAPILALAAVLATAYVGFATQHTQAPAPQPLAPSSSLTTESGRYMFNVTVHTPEAIAGLLERAETLAKTMPPNDQRTGIALVLHGPEIELFTKANYSRFQKTVDQAARLDAMHVIDIKICRTAMKDLGISETDIPKFIELVPYGPDEENRLREKGYVYL